MSSPVINLNGPTIPPPDGTVSNLVNPPNGNTLAIAIITVCVIVTANFYLIRFYAKFLTKTVNLADYLTVLSFPLYWVYVYYSYRLSWTPGYLIHEWNVALKDISGFSYICYVASLLYLWIIALVKCGILFEWTTLFAPKGLNRFFTWICYTTAAAIACISIIFFIMDLINCTPFERNWNPLIPGTCRWSVPESAMISSAANFVLDLLPLILAQKMIWGLQTSWKKRLGVSLIFLVGILGVIASIVRFYYTIRFYKSNDSTYFFSIVALCTMCETTCANLILCLPFIPRAVKGFKQTKAFTGLKYYMTLKSSTNGYSSNSNYFQAGGGTNGAKARSQERWIGMDLRTSSGKDTIHSEDSNRAFREDIAV